MKKNENIIKYPFCRIVQRRRIEQSTKSDLRGNAALY